jgi:hypothetical protein
MDPMTMLAIGGAVAGGISSIFGGKAQGAAARLRNQQATQRWIQENTQRTFANAREQFMSTYNFAQQAKRNAAIAESAYATQYEATQNLKQIESFQHRQLARQKAQTSASLLNAMGSSGISPSSGLYASLATAQALDALNNISQLKKNIQMQKSNIDKEFRAQMSAQTENIFMPNIVGYMDAPMLEDASALETAGIISGALQIGSAFAGAAVGAAGSSGSTTGTTGNPSGTRSIGNNTSTVNQFGTDVSRAPIGYNVASTASGSTLSRQPQMFSVFRR